MTNQDLFTAALTSNKAWAASTTASHPDLFRTLSQGQNPFILWLGCSDSRCPETTLLGLKPGDVFVHRNIGNIIHPADLSSAAVIEYSVRQLGVKHVVVCGHSLCGGVNAALAAPAPTVSGGKDSSKLGVLNPWLGPLRKLKKDNAALLKGLSADQAALKLVELNVLAGVRSVKTRTVVVEAMKRGLQVHGLVYDVASGVLQELEVDGASGNEGGRGKANGNGDRVVRKRVTSLTK
ncbi:carbonic anhydrase [Aspergillus undulatus]|uniref:carbonic anhydrase n=1 Tax=Aspergillus undulatus TaxID=1810928 RepID=UPI003CCCB589